MKVSFNTIHLALFATVLSASLLVKPLEAFTTSFSHSVSTTVPVSRLSTFDARAVVGGPSTTGLMERKRDISSDERGSDAVNNIIGIDRGLYLLAIVLAINVWFFSIPTEFRRTRICDEEQTRQYPDRCMTADQFKTGIADYYKNGGGVKFDFSIQGRD